MAEEKLSEEKPEEKPQEKMEEKPEEKEEVKSAGESKPAAQNQSGSGAGVVILIVVIVVVVLGVGSYFAVKYLAQNFVDRANQAASTVTTTATVATSVTITATASSTSVATFSDYVISYSSVRELTESDLTGLTPWQLKVARNEIYARHGREFVHKDLQCYFAKKTWYAIDPNFSESELTTTENKNIAMIKAYEDEINSPLASTDSGCDTNQ